MNLEDRVELNGCQFDIYTYSTDKDIISVINRSNESCCDIIAQIDIPIIHHSTKELLQRIHQLSLKSLFESLDIISEVDSADLQGKLNIIKDGLIMEQINQKEKNKIDIKSFDTLTKSIPESILAFIVIENKDIIYEYKKNIEENYLKIYKDDIQNIIEQLHNNIKLIKNLIGGCKNTIYITENITYCCFKTTDNIMTVFLISGKNFGQYIKSLEKLNNLLKNNLST